MIVELQFDLSGIQKVHLKILVVTVSLHVAAKKGRHAGETDSEHHPFPDFRRTLY